MSKKRNLQVGARTANRWKLLLAFVAVCLASWTLYVLSRATAAHAEHARTPTIEFGPIVPNSAAPPAQSPEGMVWVSGGEFSISAKEFSDVNEVGMHAMAESRPIHRVYVDGFYMDKTDVTNEEFAKFVKATGYVTVAERTPRLEDYPDVRPENLVAGAVVFSPPDHPVPLDNYYLWWKSEPTSVKGAAAGCDYLRISQLPRVEFF